MPWEGSESESESAEELPLLPPVVEAELPLLPADAGDGPEWALGEEPDSWEEPETLSARQAEQVLARIASRAGASPPRPRAVPRAALTATRGGRLRPGAFLTGAALLAGTAWFALRPQPEAPPSPPPLRQVTAPPAPAPRQLFLEPVRRSELLALPSLRR